MKPVSMTIKFGVAALLAALAQAPSAHATETPARSSRVRDIGANRRQPLGFQSNLYTWLAGIKGKLAVGPLSRSVDANLSILSTSRGAFLSASWAALKPTMNVRFLWTGLTWTYS